MPKVQVLVPCYNYARYLAACVDSVLTQPGVTVDVLIIDDCSTDDTPAVSTALAARDRRVRVIRHETNKGHIATYNEGIAQIRGDYFVLLSADDLLVPGALSRATSLMEANPSVGMVYGQPISLYGDALPPARTRQSGWSIWPGATWVELVCRSGKNFVVSPEAVVRTRVQEAIGGYDPALPHSGDMEMWLRIAAIADIGRIRGADQAYYRVHARSMQRTVHDGVLFDLIGRREAFRSAFEREAGSLAEAGRLHAVAREALANTALRHALWLLARDRATAAELEAYRSFALGLDPAIARTRRYGALGAAIAGRGPARPGPLRTLGRKATALNDLFERQIMDRLEYYRARRSGIYLPR